MKNLFKVLAFALAVSKPAFAEKLICSDDQGSIYTVVDIQKGTGLTEVFHWEMEISGKGGRKNVVDASDAWPNISRIDSLSPATVQLEAGQDVLYQRAQVTLGSQYAIFILPATWGDSASPIKLFVQVSWAQIPANYGEPLALTCK